MGFPRYCNDNFYKQFHNPLAAYSNLPSLYKFYLKNPDKTIPENCEDFVKYAWDKAREI